MPAALALIGALWCSIVLYVKGCVSVLGITYPLGRGAAATLTYSLMFADPYFPHRGKLDLPILLVHGYGLYKFVQWLWRYIR